MCPANTYPLHPARFEHVPDNACIKCTFLRLQVLKSSAPEISSQLPSATEKPSANTKPSATNPTAAAAAATRTTAAAPAAEGSTTTVAAADGTKLWKLGPSGGKHAAVSEFKGTKTIGLREYYDKDGLRPVKKGINLSIEQFGTLAENVQVLTENRLVLCSAVCRQPSLLCS